jgi:predicted DNA-binding transcriptional regulator
MVTQTDRQNTPDVAPLERCLGSTAQIKIVDSMSTFRSFDFSVEEIAGNAEISTKSVRRVLPGLLRYGIVEEHRRVGRNAMYRYNAGNPLAERLNAFIAEVAAFDATIVTERELAEEEQSEVSPPPITEKPIQKGLK